MNEIPRKLENYFCGTIRIQNMSRFVFSVFFFSPNLFVNFFRFLSTPESSIANHLKCFLPLLKVLRIPSFHSLLFRRFSEMEPFAMLAVIFQQIK